MGTANANPAVHLGGVEGADATTRRATCDAAHETVGHSFVFPLVSALDFFAGVAGFIGPVNRQIAP